MTLAELGITCADMAVPSGMVQVDCENEVVLGLILRTAVAGLSPTARQQVAHALDGRCLTREIAQDCLFQGFLAEALLQALQSDDEAGCPR